MSLVWRKIQRSNKKAAKFKFVASFQELMIHCSEKWQPSKVAIAWAHRRRRYVTKAYRWEPTITDPYRGLIVWPEDSEILEIQTTLYRDTRNESFEDKEWTFVVEELTAKGKYKPIAAVNLNLRLFISEVPGTQTEVKLKLRPLSDQVKSCIMQLVLTSSIVKEGDALDEDIQSVASMISMQQGSSNVGSRDIADMEDVDGEFGSGHSTKLALSESAGSETANQISEIAKNAMEWVQERSPDKDLFPLVPKPKRVTLSEEKDISPGDLLDKKKEKESLPSSDAPWRDSSGSKPMVNGGTEIGTDDSGFSQDILEKEPATPNSAPTVKHRLDSRLINVPSSPVLHDVSGDFSFSGGSPSQKSLKNVAKSSPNLISHDLLTWCQDVTKDYRNVNVIDFAKSWRNGMAFCAIIHHFRPDLINYDFLNPNEIRENCRLAFETAGALGVPKLLDPNDMKIMAVPDKIAVISYVHALRDHFVLGKGAGANNSNPTASRQTSAVSTASTVTEGPDDPNNRLSLFELNDRDNKVLAEIEKFKEARERASAVHELSLVDSVEEESKLKGVKWRDSPGKSGSSSRSPTLENKKKKKRKDKDKTKSPRKSPRKSTESNRSSTESTGLSGSRDENTNNRLSAERTTPLMSRKELRDPFGSVSEDEEAANSSQIFEERSTPEVGSSIERESCDGNGAVSKLVENQREIRAGNEPLAGSAGLAQRLEGAASVGADRRGSGDSYSAVQRLSRGSSSNSREEDLRIRARQLLAEFTKDHQDKGREPTPEEEDGRRRELRERAKLLISDAKYQSESGTIRISETMQDDIIANRPKTLVTPKGYNSAPGTRETTPDTTAPLRRLVWRDGKVLGALNSEPISRSSSRQSLRKIESLGSNVQMYQFRSDELTRNSSSTSNISSSSNNLSPHKRGLSKERRSPSLTRIQAIPYPDDESTSSVVKRPNRNELKMNSNRNELIKICIGERHPSQMGALQESETTFDRVKRFGSMRKQELTETIGVLSKNVGVISQSVRSASVPKQLESLSTPLRRIPIPQSASVAEKSDTCDRQEPIKTSAWEQELASHKDIVAQLEELSQKKNELDAKASQVETQWRKVMLEAQDSDEEQRLMNEFLRLLNERNLLMRQEHHLSLLENIHDYEHRFQLVQQELGNLINIEESEKTESHKQKIDRLMEQLINIVNKKDELVQQLMANEHDAEEDSALGQDVLAGKLPVPDEKCAIQ